MSSPTLRNLPGCKEKDFNSWPIQDINDMDGTLSLQQYIQQAIHEDPSNISKLLTLPESQDEIVWKYEHLR